MRATYETPGETSEANPAEFQSFTVKPKKRTNQITVTIPSKICQELKLTDDAILEIAVRKIDYQYAKKNYAVDYYPHNTICPICKNIGRAGHFLNYRVVFHRKKGRGQLLKTCYLSKEQGDELVAKYQKSMEAQL